MKRDPMLSLGGVYTITSPSGNQYVGSALCFRERWWLHRRDLSKGKHHNAPLQKAFEKYGLDGLRFDILLICDADNVLMFEQRAIDAIKPEYNICKIAGSTLGRKHTAEARKRMSDVQKALYQLPERQALMKSFWEPAVVRRRALARVGIPLSAEHRQKLRVANLGKPHTAERRAKQSAAWTDERKEGARKKIIEVAKRPWSEERRAEQRERAKRQWAKRKRARATGVQLALEFDS